MNDDHGIRIQICVLGPIVKCKVLSMVQVEFGNGKY
jgi:hypothetical protein